MTDTKVALSEAGLPSFTAMPVLGRGKGHGDFEKVESADPDLRELISTMPRLK